MYRGEFGEGAFDVKCKNNKVKVVKGENITPVLPFY